MDEDFRNLPFVKAIMDEGRCEVLRIDILDVLTIRFRADAAEFTDLLNRIQDPERLRDLHRAAIKCRGVAVFRRALQTPPAS